MKVRTIELRVPQVRDWRFSTWVVERYRRAERALVSTLIDMYVDGVSARKVGKLAVCVCEQRFSAETISNMVATLDAVLTAFTFRCLAESQSPM